MTMTYRPVHTARRAMPWLVDAVIACALLSPVASAAVVLPYPSPVPQAFFQLYTIPGAYERPDAHQGTEIFCTSLETSKPIHVGIDLRDGLGVQLNLGTNNGAADLAPGHTLTIGTHDSPAFDEDIVLALADAAYPYDGSVRIWSSSIKLACGALLIQDDTAGPAGVAAAGSSGPPPPVMYELRVIKAKFQTGD